MRPSLGRVLLARITEVHIERLYKEQLAAGYALSTLQYAHTLLKDIFKLAQKRGRILRNPMLDVARPKAAKRPEEGEPQERVLSLAQVTDFLAAANAAEKPTEQRFATLFTLAFNLGCRPGELLGLKWNDLDTTARTLQIRRSIAWRKGGDWYVKEPKTRLSRRTLPLTPDLLAVLDTHRKRQLQDKLRAGGVFAKHGFIFCDEVGEPYPQWTARWYFKEFLRAAGLPEHFTPYSARHTMTTSLLTAGVNVKVVSERLGHSNVAITLNTYTHVSPQMQAEATETIERILKGAQK